MYMYVIHVRVSQAGCSLTEGGSAALFFSSLLFSSLLFASLLFASLRFCAEPRPSPPFVSRAHAWDVRALGAGDGAGPRQDKDDDHHDDDNSGHDMADAHALPGAAR